VDPVDDPLEVEDDSLEVEDESLEVEDESLEVEDESAELPVLLAVEGDLASERLSVR
jgi:hypothetical protein